MSQFSDLKLSPALLEALAELNFVEMTPIQAQSLPLLLEGHDLVGRSQTGSGKTAAFLLPLLQQTVIAQKTPQALILCPTRELCDQVLKEARKFAKKIQGFQAVGLVGGQPYPPQVQALENGAHLVVGTPGRVFELLRSETLFIGDLKTLVLDEADRLLDEGFTEEVTNIIQLLPKNRQTVFFSATYPESVAELSKNYQQNPKTVEIESTPESAPDIEHYVYETEDTKKIETLLRALNQHPSQSTLIFCRTIETVEQIYQVLQKFSVPSRPLHGDLDQNQRNQALFLFRNGSLRVLVATDVAARGLDIDHLELVINFDLPTGPDVYLHRSGRTGRAGNSGVTVNLCSVHDTIKIFEIEKVLNKKMIRQKLGFENQFVLGKSFQSAIRTTLLISGGKKDKLRPGDILGALTSPPEGLKSESIGKIEIQPHYSLVAVESQKADEALNKLRVGKIKGLKFKVYPLEV